MGEKPILSQKQQTTSWEKHNNEKTNNNKTFHTLLKIGPVSTPLVLQIFLLIEKK